MELRYLIDSNVIIDYTSNRIPQKGSDFVEAVFNTNFLISVITEIEVLGFNDVPNKMEAIEEFISTSTILQLDKNIARHTINLRKQNSKLKLGDAIIAATAKEHNLYLITRNVNDFKNINNLKVINPHNI